MTAYVPVQVAYGSVDHGGLLLRAIGHRVVDHVELALLRQLLLDSALHLEGAAYALQTVTGGGGCSDRWWRVQ